MLCCISSVAIACVGGCGRTGDGAVTPEWRSGSRPATVTGDRYCLPPLAFYGCVCSTKETVWRPMADPRIISTRAKVSYDDPVVQVGASRLRCSPECPGLHPSLLATSSETNPTESTPRSCA